MVPDNDMNLIEGEQSLVFMFCFVSMISVSATMSLPWMTALHES